MARWPPTSESSRPAKVACPMPRRSSFVLATWPRRPLANQTNRGPRRLLRGQTKLATRTKFARRGTAGIVRLKYLRNLHPTPRLRLGAGLLCRLVMGIMSYYRLGVDLFPNVDFPVKFL